MSTALIDCHSHSALSGHGAGTVREMIARANEMDLFTYCQTEHLTLPAELDPDNLDSMPADAVEGYIADIKACREELVAAGSDMFLVCGVEADWLGEDYAETLKAAIEPFEYVLGSIHFLDGKPVDNSDDMSLWEELGVEGVWNRYVDEWLKMVRSDVPFTAFAHPDLPKVFGDAAPESVVARYQEMAEAVAARGAMVEINTAGWRKKADEQYPALELLKAFKAAGVDVTVGADAHKPEDIAADCARAYELLLEAGYYRVAMPCANGTRRWAHL